MQLKPLIRAIMHSKLFKKNLIFIQYASVIIIMIFFKFKYNFHFINIYVLYEYNTHMSQVFGMEICYK